MNYLKKLVIQKNSNDMTNKDYTNTSDTISQNQFNNRKYIKTFNTFVPSWVKTSDIQCNHMHFRLGDKVVISDKSDKHPGEMGEIVLGFSKKDSDTLKIKFKDNTTALIDKFHIGKISDADFYGH